MGKKRSEYIGNPQVEDGYTRIAHELLEALIRAKIPREQVQIFLAICRCSYGVKGRKKTKPLNYLYLGEMCNMSRQNARRAVESMIQRNMVIAKKVDYMEAEGDPYAYHFSIDKNYGYWRIKKTNQTDIIRELRESQQSQIDSVQTTN